MESSLSVILTMRLLPASEPSASLARNGSPDVRVLRDKAAQNPDGVNAQLDVADIDMIGGHIDDAFNRLFDFIPTYRDDMPAVRERLVEYLLFLMQQIARKSSASKAYDSYIKSGASRDAPLFWYFTVNRLPCGSVRNYLKQRTNLIEFFLIILRPHAKRSAC